MFAKSTMSFSPMNLARGGKKTPASQPSQPSQAKAVSFHPSFAHRSSDQSSFSSSLSLLFSPLSSFPRHLHGHDQVHFSLSLTLSFPLSFFLLTQPQKPFSPLPSKEEKEGKLTGCLFSYCAYYCASVRCLSRRKLLMHFWLHAKAAGKDRGREEAWDLPISLSGCRANHHNPLPPLKTRKQFTSPPPPFSWGRSPAATDTGKGSSKTTTTTTSLDLHTVSLPLLLLFSYSGGGGGGAEFAWA